MKLDQRVAVVTGGGRGIGRTISLRFAAEGAAVVVAGTGRDHLESTVAAIQAGGGKALVSITDVADETAVERMIAAARGAFGRIDILVNNAGITGPTAPVTGVALADWDRTLAVNLTGAFLCSKHALPHLVRQGGGRIINITSVAGLAGYALRAPYAASKWGVIGLTRTLALEAGEFGVTVNAIAPGPVAGERIADVIRRRATELGRSVEDIELSYVEPTALKRMVDPEDVAATALFLASDEGRSITGETISVSSGFRV
jgi:NAD(P)-dependent dehydrogenase (short-subunit alcohol dehydrogenase family)